MNDILKTSVKQHQDNDYYVKLLEQYQTQLEQSERAEKRHATIASTMAEKQHSLEIAMIEAWDDTGTFARLKGEYEGLQVIFYLAPKAAAYWQQRARNLQHKGIEIRNNRDAAMVSRNAAAQEAKREAERIERERVQALEVEARIAKNKAETEAMNAEKNARIAAQQAQIEADKQDSLSWLKQLINGKE